MRTGFLIAALPVCLLVGPAAAQTPDARQAGEAAADYVALDYDAWAQPLDPADHDGSVLAVCFDALNPPSDEFIRRLHEDLAAAGRLQQELAAPEGSGIELFQAATRWSGGGFGSTGDPITLTWSFVPDGLNIPNGVGEGAGPSELFARMDALFGGNRALWIQRIDESFERWGEVAGLTYTRVTFGGNDWDDGANWGSAGSPGLRGDVRISMKLIDGGSGILAYNQFPNNGDMVLDRGETWSTSSFSHRFLRNIIMHEHGHGLGFAHVCSTGAKFLMEPFLDTTFDGLRHDEVRGGQRQYGDPFETDNIVAQANPLGTLAAGTLSNVCNLPAPAILNTTACSIDANGEVDVFSFDLTTDALLSITVTPHGFTYDDSPQNNCGSNETNSLTAANLEFQVLDSDGVSVLATVAAQPAGVAETLTDLAVPGSTPFYLRVFESAASGANTQMYSLSLTVTADVACPGDGDGDGDVDLDDLLLVLGSFGGSGAGDLDFDGDVDLDDLLLVLGNFGGLCV